MVNGDGVFGYTCHCSDGFHGVRCEGTFRQGPSTTTLGPSDVTSTLGPSDVTSTSNPAERPCQNLGKRKFHVKKS